MKKDSDSERKIIYEEEITTGPVYSKLIIFKRISETPKGYKRVNCWILVLLLGLIVLLITILIAACLLSFNSRRPGLYGEDCIRRSCETKLGLKCINSICNCQSNEYYLKHCLPKKPFGNFCNHAIDQCMLGMTCFNGKCGCNRTFTWNRVKCVKKSSYDGICENIECDSSQFLICNNNTKTCDCDSATRFWSGNSCILKRGYNEKCASTNECISDKGLFCLNGLCLCNQTYEYFDSIIKQCESRKMPNFLCSNSNECLGDLTCSNGFCVCANATTHYFNESSLLCTLKSLNNLTCSIIDTCRQDLGLICTSGKCQCDVGTKYWDGSLCTAYKLYNQTCSTQSQCSTSQNTLCLSGFCTCNSTYNYYDSSLAKCQLKINETISCTQDIQCLGNMACLSGTCACANTTTHYFNQSSLTCSSKTLRRTTCTTSISCRQDLGLICNSSHCVCDPSTPFWSSVRFRCVVCPSGWTVKSDYCFYMNVNNYTWQVANDWCATYGATLPNFQTITDYNFFKSEFFTAEFWIGLRLIGGTWKWTSDNVTFYNPSVPSTKSSWWNINEPSSGDVYGRLNNGFEVWARPSTSIQNFLCQMI